MNILYRHCIKFIYFFLFLNFENDLYERLRIRTFYKDTGRIRKKGKDGK